MPPELTSPYARTLGLVRTQQADRLIVSMPLFDGLIGRPGFLHGGAIAGLLEFAAWTTLLDAIADDPARIKPIGITVDFLRGGRLIESHASADIVRLGRRIANVTAIAWQDDPAKPMARADLKLLLVRDSS